MKLEKRMYVLVHRSLSAMQKGIQAAHAIVDYQRNWGDTNDSDYVDWVKNWKTIIVLDGGTNSDMVNYYYKLMQYSVKAVFFKEPDLCDTMTAIAFIVDETIFNDDKYLETKNDDKTTLKEFLLNFKLAI